MRRRVFALTMAPLLLFVASAGCLGTNGGSPDGETLTSSATPEGARLLVEVLDLTQRPIKQASVRVETVQGPLASTTDDTGAAWLGPLVPGPAQLVVEAPDHRPRALTLDVPAEGEVARTVVLAPLGANATYVQTYEFEGFFECSATFVIITGDCFATIREVGRQAGAPLGENATNERFVFSFPLAPGWTGLTITQTWDDAEVAAGSMMRINLEPAMSGDNELHNERYARVQGGSPLVLALAPGQVHELASDDALAMPEDGGLFQTRTFHLGYEQVHDAAGAGTLGAGAALQQHFTLVAEVTYG